MSESSKSTNAGQPHGKSKSDKAQAEQREQLLKVVSSLNERLSKWVDSTSLPDVEALTELFRHVGFFLGPTKSDERTSEKFSTLDRALSEYLIKHGKQIAIPNPLPTDVPIPTGIGETIPSEHQPSVEPASAMIVTQQINGQENNPVQSVSYTSPPNEFSKGVQTSKPSFDLTAAISELKQVQQKLSENEKKATRGFEAVRESVEKNEGSLGLIRSNLNRLPTTDSLNSVESAVLEAIQKLRMDLQEVQFQVGEIQAGTLRNIQVLDTVNSGVDDIRATINGKIDLADAHKVLDYRSMMESHIQASVIDHLSKQILLPLEALKGIVAGQTGDIADTVAALEERCKKAGLSIE